MVKKILLLLAMLLFSASIFADVTIKIFQTEPEGEGKFLGTIVASDTQYGLLLTPNLTGLPPGPHGFHIHQNPTCVMAGDGAGGHLDPQHTNSHLGPYNPNGHLGDLPVLIVDQNGNATIPVLAPRLNVQTIMGHSIMIHAGSDNYSNTPKMGGGGARFACGVIGPHG